MTGVKARIALADHKRTRDPGEVATEVVHVTGVEHEGMVGGQAAGWYPDPLAPPSRATRSRWWTGSRWSSRVRSPLAERGPAVGAPGPTTFLAEVPEAVAWIPWLYRLAPPPVLKISAIPAAAVPRAALAFDADPMVIASGRPDPTASTGVHWKAPEAVEGAVIGATDGERPPSRARRHRRRVETLAFAAALVLLVGGAIAGADVVSGGRDQRPTLESAVIYRDAGAGFALRSPTGWREIERERGTGIRFAIGAAGAPTTETNTVSVDVGTTSAALPELHTLADQLTERLRGELPDIRLEEAGRAQIAGAPGLRFTFVDPTIPQTRIEQYVGRTTAGRPLTITVTVREPRTAPNAAELDEFLASIKAI
jgi:hypothetical protein